MAGTWLCGLSLSHFRTHRDATLAPDSRPVAIFGPNGAGKTNLIEAVSLLSPGRGLRRAATPDLARRPETLGWRVGADVVTPRAGHQIDTRAAWGEPRAVRLDGKAATQADLGHVLRVLWLVPAMDRLWTDGAEVRRRFLDRLTLGFEPAHGDAVLAWDKAMRDRNRLLKDQVQDPRWYAALEGRMALAGAAIEANRSAALALVRSAQTDARTTFPLADLALIASGPPPEVDAIAGALRDGRPRDMAAGRTLTGPHRADLAATYAEKRVAAAQCSTGEQKALLISLLLANARALTTAFGATPILLLDEVAAHLDEDRRAALYDELCAMGAQAWMTGTDATLFEALGKRAQRWDVRERDGESVVRIVQ